MRKLFIVSCVFIDFLLFNLSVIGKFTRTDKSTNIFEQVNKCVQ